MKRTICFLLFILFLSCSCSAPIENTTKDEDVIRQEGYDIGYDVGYNAGYSAGYEAGRDEQDAPSTEQIVMPEAVAELDVAQAPTTNVPSIEPEPIMGYVDARSLNLRDAPDRESDIVMECEGGTTVEITGEDGDWYAVIADGKHGYMLKEYIAFDRESSNDASSNSPEEATLRPEATKPPAASADPTEVVTPKPSSQAATTGQKNALRKAKDYLRLMAFSHSGLVKQLEYEGFSSSEAIYGADNCGADWNEQAVKKAAEYLNMMAFSRSDLIRQLEHEGFTSSQATYGASQNGY